MPIVVEMAVFGEQMKFDQMSVGMTLSDTECPFEVHIDEFLIQDLICLVDTKSYQMKWCS